MKLWKKPSPAAKLSILTRPDWQIEAWVSTYTAIAKGELAAVSDDLPQLLGRAPLNFEDVVRAQYAK